MPDTPDIREQLAAYLAGELDEAATVALEARMADEPWVARAADEMADMLLDLQRVDEVAVPDGFAARLTAGLAEEIGHPLPAVPGTARSLDRRMLERSGAAAADGHAERPDRARDGGDVVDGTARFARWRPAQVRAALAVAAGVAVLFVGSLTVTQSGFLGGSDDAGDEGVDETVRSMDAEEDAMAADDAEEAPVEEPAEDSAAELAAGAATMEEESAVADDAADADTADAGGEGAGPDAITAAPAPLQDAGGEGPVALDAGELSDDDAIRLAIGGNPAVQRLLGRPADDVAGLAEAFTDELLRADPLPDGTDASACLLAVLRDSGDGVTPAVAAAITQDDRPRLAYALVRSSDGVTADQVDVWVAEPDACGVVAVVS